MKDCYMLKKYFIVPSKQRDNETLMAIGSHTLSQFKSHWRWKISFQHLPNHLPYAIKLFFHEYKYIAKFIFFFYIPEEFDNVIKLKTDERDPTRVDIHCWPQTSIDASIIKLVEKNIYCPE